MTAFRKLSLLLFGLLLLAGCQGAAPGTPEAPPTPTYLPAPTPTLPDFTVENEAALAANARIGRSINLGNALDGPTEGAWGLYLQPHYFEVIAGAGFDSVRVPVRWSKYAGLEAPFTINDRIFTRVDWVIEQAFANDLAVIINVHHFEAIMEMPDQQAPRLVEMWRQIAARYQDYPDTLYFEILNEPTDNLDSETWNWIFPQALAAIRETNPDRYVIIGPDRWNNINRLPTLALPLEDRRIIVTFHYYNPHPFTHQSAPWEDLGDEIVPWGSAEDVQALQDDFDAAAAWADTEGRPLFMGEFGVYIATPEEYRVRWLSSVRAEAEKRGFSWAHWDFGTDFAIYNLITNEWREPFLKALIPDS